MNTHNALTWFEIPVIDLNRAGQFYAKVLRQELKNEQFGPNVLLIFRYQQPGVGGCLMNHKEIQPSTQGTLVYLPIDDSLDAALNRVTQAGGQVLLGRTELPEGMGCYAQIKDSEGNRVGLHATN